VEAIEPNRLIRLRAEMKVPGKAWLEFQSLPQPDGKTLLTQTAYILRRAASPACSTGTSSTRFTLSFSAA
jgi:hypothetical protein